MRQARDSEPLTRNINDHLRELLSSSEAQLSHDASRAAALARDAFELARALGDDANMDAAIELLDRAHAQIQARSEELKVQLTTLQVERHQTREEREARSRFLSLMGHELRTPLSVVMGYTELVREDLLDLTDELTGAQQMSDDLQHVLGAAQRLTGLFDKLMQLSVLETGGREVEITSMDAARMCQDVQEKFAHLSEGDELDFTLALGHGEDGELQSDRARVREILSHLVENALAYTERGHVRLETRRARRDGASWFVFSVADTGPGVPEKFARALSRRRVLTPSMFDGRLGLGLALSQRHARLIGGDLVLAQSSSEGSTFELWLPAP